MQSEAAINLGIVTAYNDMLSAHQPYAGYPDQIRAIAHQNKATAQVAGGVPAMCDGVTQGEDGMDLSLFSRDTIAMSTAIALSHNLFDAVICLGICDKIVPGLMIERCPSAICRHCLSRRTDAVRTAEFGKSQGTGSVRSGRGWPAAAHCCGISGLSCPRNLYLLWYRQQQSDADGVHGSAVTGWIFR